MDRKPMLPAVERFVADMRALFASGLGETERWEKARDLMGTLLADPDLARHARAWPESLTVEGSPGNLLFYEDPDHGFVINALIKRPDVKTSVHDHGPSWTLYGVIEGGEEVLRFERTDHGPQVADRATVRPAASHQVRPGYIDFVPPWVIHAEYNGPHRTVAVIVRSQRSGTFVQNRFDPATGRAEQYGGPAQIPFHLGA